MKNIIKKIEQNCLFLKKNKRKADLNFKLACNLRSRTSSAFKSQKARKKSKTFDLLG